MNIRRLTLVLLFLVLLVSCGRQVVVDPAGGAQGENGSSESATTTPRPTREALEGTTVLAEGQILAVNPALPLSFTVNGRLLEIYVDPSDKVQEGDLIATLDDEALQEAITSAELQLAQSENALAQSQLSLDVLLSWEPDEMAVALAEANLAAAEASFEKAQTQDAAAANSLTSANVNINQAERALADVQEAYDVAFDPGREWELNDPFRKQLLENEREGVTRALQQAQESLEIARANYRLTLAGLNDNTAINAETSILSAQQALHQAQTGPKTSDITAAQLQVTQAELSLQQAQINLEKAQQAIENAQLLAPWSGTVLSVDAVPGANVGNGVPIITLFDSENLEFHTSNLSERDLAYIAPGQPVQVTLKSYPANPISGVVDRVKPQAGGKVGDSATFTVVITLEKMELTLLAGMTGRAEIQRFEGGG